MRETVAPAQYLQIALDIAGRVAAGKLPEGTRLYGRSVLASEYAVSPETIRRALRLLADMKVVDIKPQSGAVVLSADSARRYIDNFDQAADTRALEEQLKSYSEQYRDLGRKIQDTVSALIRSREIFSSAEPLPNYEVMVPESSPVLGKSVGELKFWQSTGGTIVAIRRGPSTILSPGPYAQLYAGDVIVLVGNDAAIQAAQRFVSVKEELYDPI